MRIRPKAWYAQEQGDSKQAMDAGRAGQPIELRMKPSLPGWDRRERNRIGTKVHGAERRGRHLIPLVMVSQNKLAGRECQIGWCARRQWRGKPRCPQWDSSQNE